MFSASRGSYIFQISIMQYAFILGRVYTLSLAEIISVLGVLGISYKVLACSPDVLVVETDQPLKVEPLQARLGGVIKIIKLFDTFQKKGKEFPSQVLSNYFTFKRIKDYFQEYSGKKQFGVSIYSLDPSVHFHDEAQRVAFLIKKLLQEQAQSVRAVLPQFPAQALSSVQVTENQILQKGAEIVVISGNQRLFVGKTLSVQNYEDYGRRDFQRPARDEKVGMIPPKVAQTMINMSMPLKPLDTILDPFCGSGTILQEAILMGYKALGSDLEQKMIENSEKNLEWFRNRYHVSPGRYKLAKANAAELSIMMPHIKPNAIVTEGTLGPIYGRLPKKPDMVSNFTMLQKLYNQVFKEFNKLMDDGTKVVMCLPAYRTARGEYHFMPSLDFVTENGYTILDPIPEYLRVKYRFLRVTERKSIIYDRKDQVVAREIFIFQKGEIKQETVVEDANALETESGEELNPNGT